MKGIHGEFYWVELFQVSSSNDGYTWKKIRNKNTNEDTVFLGNYDSDTLVTQYFEQLINARYLRIIPIRWHSGIGMRLEVIGCYEPYKKVTTQIKGQTKPPNPYIAEGPPPLAISIRNKIISCVKLIFFSQELLARYGLKCWVPHRGTSSYLVCLQTEFCKIWNISNLIGFK